MGPRGRAGWRCTRNARSARRPRCPGSPRPGGRACRRTAPAAMVGYRCRDQCPQLSVIEPRAARRVGHSRKRPAGGHPRVACRAGLTLGMTCTLRGLPCTHLTIGAVRLSVDVVGVGLPHHGDLRDAAGRERPEAASASQELLTGGSARVGEGRAGHAREDRHAALNQAPQADVRA